MKQARAAWEVFSPSTQMLTPQASKSTPVASSSLALILTVIIMMLLIGTLPSPSTASEHVSTELLGLESPIVVPVLHLTIAVHGRIANYCCIS
jgi:hypothetical protein